jgi:acetyl esterase/lipase
MLAAVWASAMPADASRVQTPRPVPILQDPETVRLWAATAPGALGESDEDVPTLTIYMPPNTAGPMTAVIVAPGGSYQRLSTNLEGRAPANFLNGLGIAAFVLKYRLGPKYHHPVQMGDAYRAIRTVRSRAIEWHVAPDRIGIMGFSAGGHLASTVSVRVDAADPSAPDPIDRVSGRPDFAILGYPVITFVEPWTHQGSKTMLLGANADAALARSLSNETQVTSTTPPTFLFHTNADTTVPVENSVQYFLALRKAGVPAELHVFRDGGHGVGLALQDPMLSEWTRTLANWLRASGLIK